MWFFVLNPVERAVPAADEQVIILLAEYVVAIPITGNWVKPNDTLPGTVPFSVAKYASVNAMWENPIPSPIK